MLNRHVSVDAAHLYIEALDLNYIIEVMCSSNYVLPQWELNEARHCARLYKNFLLLKKKYFSIPLVPSREIDEFWHNHILYTRHYFKDCLNIFGHYLHHEPASTKEDPEQLVNDYIKTKQLYLKEFGKPLDLIHF